MTAIERRARILVQGAVQGVGYRWFARSRARALKLAGLVRNLDDGNVELLVSGRADDVLTFVGELEQGPPRARVVKVDVDDAPEGSYFPNPFDIAHE